MRMAVVFLIFVFAFSVVPCRQLLAGEEKTDNKVKLNPDEQKILDLTNEARAEQRLPPLALSPILCRVARQHSANMARKKELSHVLDGKNPQQRVVASGYRAIAYGENIANHEDPAVKMTEIMNGWMHSKVHRANILNSAYKEIGIGVARGEGDSVYCTQVFARPQPSP